MPGLNKNTRNLPAVPEVLLELVGLSRGQHLDVDAAVPIVLHDPALVTRLLHLLPLEHGLPRLDRASLTDLISRVGIDVLGSIASSVAVNQFYSRFWPGRDRHLELWSRSLKCACLARALAEVSGYPEPDEAYLAGLMHNLAQFCFLAEAPEQYAATFESQVSLEERQASEKEWFGATSDEYAASLTLAWARDGLLSDAILFQNKATEAVLDSPELVRLINLSCKLLQAELWENKALFEDATRSFGLSAGQLLDVRTRARVEQAEIISGYGFVLQENGSVDRAGGGRKALNEHVCDTALVGSIDISASPDPWQASVSQFENLFDISRVIALRYEGDDKTLRAVGFGSGVSGERLERLEIACDRGTNVLSEACRHGAPVSTLDEDYAELQSGLQLQLQRILGMPALLAMPLFGQGKLLGVLLVGVDKALMESLSAGRKRLDYFLSRLGSQLGSSALLASVAPDSAESRLQEYLLHTRQLVHEANNPLGVVANYLQVLTLKFEQDTETRRQLDILREEVHRVADILTSMRELPQEGESKATAVDVNRVIEELVSVFKVSLFEPNGINCTLRLDRKIQKVDSKSVHLKQILTNLLKNAVEAIEARGEGAIAIETNAAIDFDGRKSIRIVVSDDGPGIAPNIIDHLFTAAISSKSKPHSGIGLLVVKRLVEDLGGQVLAYSGEDQGARFELVLPAQ